MRYIIATQTLSNFGTRWRSQIGLFLAGYQPSGSQDQPNSGLTATEVRAAGGVPPSELPPPSTAAGVFTAVEGRQAITVRLPYLDAAVRRRWLAHLPNREEGTATAEGPLLDALPTTEDTASKALERQKEALPTNAVATTGACPEAEVEALNEARSGSTVAVTPEERASILAARAALIAELAPRGETPSRRAICRRVFNGAKGGAAYRKVQTVLDEVPTSPS